MGIFDKFRQNENIDIPRGEPVPQKNDTSDLTTKQAATAHTYSKVQTETPRQGTLHHQTQQTEPIMQSVSQVPVQPTFAVVPATHTANDNVVTRDVKPYAQKEPVNHVVGQTCILAILNQKGGVGKSTTAVNLSAALGAQGKSVLLVDLDPQGNATSGLGIDKNQIQNDTYSVLISQTRATDAIIPDICPGVDIIPATINLAGAEVELVNEMARENRLKAAIGALRGKYDYVFIDCPPSLGLLTVNALVAADKLFIPIQCEFYALEGVTKLLESMKRVKNMLNPSLEIFGVLLTMYDSRTTLSRQVAEEVRKYFGVLVFETMIPRTVKLSEAPSYGQPITEYDPTGKGAQAYWTLAEEVIRRG